MGDSNTRVTAYLAQLDVLTREIARRSDGQDRLVQLHLTILVAIGGAALAPKGFSGLVVLGAISASIFCLWWLDHAMVIAKLGLYLADPVETGVQRAVGEFALGWELSARNDLLRAEEMEEFNQRMAGRFANLVWLTFILPGLTCLYSGIVLVLLGLARRRGVIPSEWLPKYDYSYLQLAFLSALLVIGAWLLFRRVKPARIAFKELGQMKEAHLRKMRTTHAIPKFADTTPVKAAVPSSRMARIVEFLLMVDG